MPQPRKPRPLWTHSAGVADLPPFPQSSHPLVQILRWTVSFSSRTDMGRRLTRVAMTTVKCLVIGIRYLRDDAGYRILFPALFARLRDPFAPQCLKRSQSPLSVFDLPGANLRQRRRLRTKLGTASSEQRYIIDSESPSASEFDPTPINTAVSKAMDLVIATAAINNKNDSNNKSCGCSGTLHSFPLCAWTRDLALHTSRLPFPAKRLINFFASSTLLPSAHLARHLAYAFPSRVAFVVCRSFN